MPIDEGAQAVLVETGDLAGHELDARHLDDILAPCGATAAHGRLHARLLQLACEPFALFREGRDAVGDFAWTGGQRGGRTRELITIPLVGFERLQAANRFDAAYAGGDAAFREDREQPDVAGGAHVRAAA